MRLYKKIILNNQTYSLIHISLRLEIENQRLRKEFAHDVKIELASIQLRYVQVLVMLRKIQLELIPFVGLFKQ